MISLTSFVENARILHDVGQGLLCRIYVEIRKSTDGNERPLVLSSKDFKTVRLRTEKSFPEQVDYYKVPGGDLFLTQAIKIRESLNYFNDLISDLVEFELATLDFLSEAVRHFGELKFDKNQILCVLYLDLLVCYIRVMLLFASLEERKMIYGLHAAATVAACLPRSELWNEALTLLSRSDNVSRHFIDAFGHLVKFLKPLLLQIKPSYHYAEDIDMLRANSILNPMYEGLDMGKPIENYLITTIDGITTTTSATAHATNPANMQTTATVTHASVNTLSKISVHIEIMNLQKYMDYVVLVSLACPPLLYDEKCFELFKEVSTGTLFVEIFRDVALSIHDEFDKLLIVFPSKTDKDTFEKPHGYKLKNRLKDVARQAMTDAPLRLRLRRSYILAELGNLRKLLTLNPGLLGPKFPLILSALAFAKKEVLSYFQHIDQQDSIRKDCRKFYDLQDYLSSHITPLLYEMSELVKIIIAFRCIVVAYYSEYLLKVDLKEIASMCETLVKCGKYLHINPYLEAIPNDIRNNLSSTSSSSGSSGQTVTSESTATAAAADKVDKSTDNSTNRNSNGGDTSTTATTTGKAAAAAGVNSPSSAGNSLESIQQWCHECLNLYASKSKETVNTFEVESERKEGYYYADYGMKTPKMIHSLETIFQVSDDSNKDNRGSDNSSSSGVSGNRPLQFQAFRLNFERMLNLMSASSLNYFSSTDRELLQSLVNRLYAAYYHSLYVDSLTSLLSTYAIPYEIYWYRTNFLTAHAMAYTHTGGQAYPAQSFLYIDLTKYAVCSIHKDCMEEVASLIEQSRVTSYDMIAQVKSHLLSQILKLSEMYMTLESHCQPLEAGYRLQRVMEMKRKGIMGGILGGGNGNNNQKMNTFETVEPLPGLESELADRESSAKYSGIRSNINHIMTAIQKQRFFMTPTSSLPAPLLTGTIMNSLHSSTINGQQAMNELNNSLDNSKHRNAQSSRINSIRQFDLHNTVLNMLKELLFRKFHSFFFLPGIANQTPGMTYQVLERMSVAKAKFTSFCYAIQTTLSCTEFASEFSDMLRLMLCHELFEYRVPYPGQKIPHNLTTEHIFGASNNRGIRSTPYFIYSSGNGHANVNGGGGGNNKTPSEAASQAAMAVAATNTTTGNLHAKFRSLMHAATAISSPSKMNGMSDQTHIPLIWRLTSWLETIVDALVHPKTTHVYCEHTKSITPVPTNRLTYKTSSEIDTKLNREDLRHLCQMVGPHGVRVMDSYLIKLIATKMLKFPQFLTTQKNVLTQIKTEFMTNIKIVSQYKHIPEFESSLIYIGVCLVVRQLLHEALAESMKIMFPSLMDTMKTVVHSINGYEDTSMATNLYTLGTDMGEIPPLDLSLIQSLAPIFDLPSDNIWKLFPIATSLIFLSDRWDHANYNIFLEAFDKNEHCCMIAITKIMLCISANENIMTEFMITKSSKPLSPRNNHKTQFPKGLEQFQIIPRTYLHISSQVLLYLRSQDGVSSSWDYKKSRSTTLLMSIFIKYIHPFLDRSVVEKYFPYMLLHSSLVDVSLDRVKFYDPLGTFSKSKRDTQMTAADKMSAENGAQTQIGMDATRDSSILNDDGTAVGTEESALDSTAAATAAEDGQAPVPLHGLASLKANPMSQLKSPNNKAPLTSPSSQCC